MTKTCDKTFMPDDMTIGLVVGERLNSFKYSYVSGHVFMYTHMMTQCSFCSQCNIILKLDLSYCSCFNLSNTILVGTSQNIGVR